MGIVLEASEEVQVCHCLLANCCFPASWFGCTTLPIPLDG